MELGDVKTLQFELWQNCNNGCKFCYLNGIRINSTPAEQVETIKKVREIINSPKLQDYNAIGLIGGEFFQGQLKDPEVKSNWLDLMTDMSNYLRNGTLVECWITASLMSEDLSDLFETLDLYPIADKKLLLSTSYDEKGRFHTEKQRQVWLNNLKVIKEKYPNIYLHTQVIVTQDFLDKFLVDTSYIQEILKYSWVDFKLPSILRQDYMPIHEEITVEKYYNLLQKTKDKFPDGFFIKRRDDFLKFVQKLAQLFGVEKIKWFCGNEVRSKTLYLMSTNEVMEDRWDPNEQRENAPCGHVYDSYCYLDSDKCARCDAMKLYEQLKELA